MNLEGKLAIVTGASKGIGLAVVELLLEQGAKVAGWSRKPVTIDSEDFLHVEADVSDGESVANAYQQTVDHFESTPSILINNAGVGFMAEMLETTFDQWKMMFDVNVHGIFHCSTAAIPAMKAAGTGHIINVGSVAGRNPVKNMVGYAGTKHAVTGISHSMFMELREYGIKVTCIYPGSVKTNFFDDFDGIEAHDNMMMPQDVASSIVHCLNTPDNYLPVDFEVRPLKPKG